VIFSKNSNANIHSLDTSERSHENLSYNVLLVDAPSVVRELSPENWQTSRYISFCSPWKVNTLRTTQSTVMAFESNFGHNSETDHARAEVPNLGYMYP